MVSWDVTSVVCRHSSTFEWNLTVELHGVITHKTAIFIPLEETYYKRWLSLRDGTGKKTTYSRITVIMQMIWKSSTDKEVMWPHLYLWCVSHLLLCRTNSSPVCPVRCVQARKLHAPCKISAKYCQWFEKNKFCTHCKKKNPVYAMKAYTGSRGVDPSIFNLGTRWRWVVNITPRPLYSSTHWIVLNWTVLTHCTQVKKKHKLKYESEFSA